MPRRVYPNLRAFLEANKGELLAGDLADELGCSMSEISMIKWGTRQPKLELALKIAERCNVPLESLVMRRNGQRKAS